jgi:sigma-E factor negative regulatory protein RseC
MESITIIDMAEEIREEGVVVEVREGVALVSIIAKGSCEGCGARILCRTSGEENPHVTVRDPLGVEPGYHVRISAPGRSVLLASVFLYGIPLLLLLIGIAFGAKLAERNPELNGSLLGIGLCALYYGILRIASGTERHKTRLMPHIDKII